MVKAVKTAQSRGTAKESRPGASILDASSSGAPEEEDREFPRGATPLPDDAEEETEDDLEDLNPEDMDSPLELSGSLLLDQDPALDPPDDGLPAFTSKLPRLPSDSPKALARFTHNPPERTRDSLHLYLKEINRFSLLQPEEELALARKVKESGDAGAAFRLVSSHLRLVVRIAMDFQRRWMQNILDLVQEGNVGLLRAVSKFDPEKGIKFSYYASFWIKAYILKFIMDNWRLVKIGTTQTQRKLFYNLNKERQQLISMGYDPDTAMLAQRLNVSEEHIVEMEQRLDASDMSLDAPVSLADAGAASRMDYLPALGPGIEETLGNNEISHMVRERLQSLVPRLNDKERHILERRLLSDEPATLREIGEMFHITRERVRQIEARLLQKVRDHLFDKIKDFSQDWIEQ
jgi:RNA polymerase sigma-32 factor